MATEHEKGQGSNGNMMVHVTIQYVHQSECMCLSG